MGAQQGQASLHGAACRLPHQGMVCLHQRFMGLLPVSSRLQRRSQAALRKQQLAGWQQLAGQQTLPQQMCLQMPIPVGRRQRPGFVDMLLSANGALPEPLVAFELKRPGKIPVSAGRPAPDAVECWKARKEGGALSSALQQSCRSML